MKIKARHREILLMVKDNWVRLALSSGCSALVAGATAAMAYLVKPALDDVLIQKDEHMLIVLPFVAVLVVSVKGVAVYANEYLLSYVGHDIIRKLKNRLYDHMLELPLSFFQKERTGDLMSRITSDVSIVNSMFTSTITGVCPNVAGSKISNAYLSPALSATAAKADVIPARR